MQGQKKIDWNLMKRSFFIVLLNGWITGFMRALLLTRIAAGRTLYSVENPTWSIYVLQVIVMAFLADVVFYTTHRTMHHKYLYPHFHKQHHQYLQPVAVSGAAAHPLDHLIVNEMTTLVPPVLVGADLNLTVLWFCVASINGPLSHCGYKLRSFVNTNRTGSLLGSLLTFVCPSGGDPHDFHHKYFLCEFGAGGYMDWFFGTRVMDLFSEKEEK
eukprot:TRINITY_DN1233_c0_g1_i2.p1 TRINITY_DN1233_c0_g1~~TRINITY_DN1233_c0_g1_i2.p1  ORF type:complete len:214 (+),score=31.22 TRINITY_DN1233_c0_g1_i2:409-1050(+)